MSPDQLWILNPRKLLKKLEQPASQLEFDKNKCDTISTGKCYCFSIPILLLLFVRNHFESNVFFFFKMAVNRLKTVGFVMTLREPMPDL